MAFVFKIPVGVPPAKALIEIPSDSSGTELKKLVLVSCNNASLKSFVYCLSVSGSSELPVVTVSWKLEFDGCIHCVQLGGSASSRDKIFIVLDSLIVGISKLGKQFFSLDTNITEPIMDISVHGNDLSLFSNHSYLFYVSGEEKGFWWSEHELIDMVAPMDKSKYDVILASRLRKLYLIKDSQVINEILLDFSLCSLVSCSNQLILLGTEMGEMILLQYADTTVKFTSLFKDGQSSPIQRLQCFSSPENMVTIALITEDGILKTFELRGLEAVETHSINAGENDLRGVAFGPSYVLILGFSGNLRLLKFPRAVSTGTIKSKQEYLDAISLLKLECSELAKKIENIKKLEKSLTPGSVVKLPAISCTFKFYYSPEKDCLIFNFSSQNIISKVLISGSYSFPLSSNNLEIYTKQKNTTELIANDDIFSFSITLNPSGCFKDFCNVWFIVYFKNLDSFCWIKKISLSILFPFEISNSFDQAELSSLSVRGDYTLLDISNWLKSFFIQVPQITNITFPQSFYWKTTSTKIVCVLNSKGNSTFMSNSPIVMNFLKNSLVKRQTNLVTELEISSACLNGYLNCLYEQYNSLLQEKRSKLLYEGLRDIKECEQDISYFSKHLLDLLNGKEPIFNENLFNSIIENVVECIDLQRSLSGAEKRRLIETMKKSSEGFDLSTALKII